MILEEKTEGISGHMEFFVDVDVCPIMKIVVRVARE